MRIVTAVLRTLVKSGCSAVRLRNLRFAVRLATKKYLFVVCGAVPNFQTAHGTFIPNSSLAFEASFCGTSSLFLMTFRWLKGHQLKIILQWRATALVRPPYIRPWQVYRFPVGPRGLQLFQITRWQFLRASPSHLWFKIQPLLHSSTKQSFGRQNYIARIRHFWKITAVGNIMMEMLIRTEPNWSRVQQTSAKSSWRRKGPNNSQDFLTSQKRRDVTALIAGGGWFPSVRHRQPVLEATSELEVKLTWCLTNDASAIAKTHSRFCWIKLERSASPAEF